MRLRTVFSPPQLARHYRVSAGKVIGWIETGELEAMNLATTTTGRPRYKITEEAVEAFELRRAVLGPQPKVRRKGRVTRPAGFVEYFPE